MSQFLEDTDISKHRNQISCDKNSLLVTKYHIFNMNIIITMQNLVAYNAGFFQRQSFKLVATITSRTEQQWTTSSDKISFLILNLLLIFFFFDGPALSAGGAKSDSFGSLMCQFACLVSQVLAILAGLIEWDHNFEFGMGRFLSISIR